MTACRVGECAQREMRSVSGGKEAGPSGGAELHVIVPGKFWGSTEEMEGERRRGQARTNAIRALEIESTILPGIFATERV